MNMIRVTVTIPPDVEADVRALMKPQDRESFSSVVADALRREVGRRKKLAERVRE